MIVAQVTSPVPMRTATGRKSPRHFTLETETRCLAPNEMRKALKMPDRKRPMFRILGLHPGYGSRFLQTAACIALAVILAGAPASRASWSHGSSGNRSHHASSSYSSSGTHRSHHRKSY